MRNLFKADLYRVNKSKAIYLIAIVCSLFVLFSASVYRGIGFLSTNVITEDIANVEIAGLGSVGEMSDVLSDTFGSATAFSTAVEILKSDTLVYCLIVIFIMVSAIEFSSGTIKNSLASGISRKDIYFSKLYLSCVYTIAYCFVYFVSAIIFSMLLYWDALTLNEFGQLLWIFIRQLPVYIGIIAAGHYFIFVTQSTAFSVGLFVGMFMLSNSLLPMLDLVLNMDIKITLLFPFYQCIELTKDSVSTGSYLTIYGSTMAYIVLFGLLGYWKFKKSEIK